VKKAENHRAGLQSILYATQMKQTNAIKKEKKERKKKSLVCPLEIRDSSRFQVP